jgi:hypothetical protein
VQLAAAVASSAPVELFDVRVLPDSGLIYVASKPLAPPSEAKQAEARPSKDGAPAPGTADLSHPGRPGSGPPPGAALPAGGEGRRGARRGRGRGRGIRRADWQEVTALRAYPFTAVGLIESTLGSMNAKCRWGAQAVLVLGGGQKPWWGWGAGSCRCLRPPAGATTRARRRSAEPPPACLAARVPQPPAGPLPSPLLRSGALIGDYTVATAGVSRCGSRAAGRRRSECTGGGRGAAGSQGAARPA